MPPSTGSPAAVEGQPECATTPIVNGVYAAASTMTSAAVAAVNGVCVGTAAASTVASVLDDEDTAAIGELVTAYRESLKVTAPSEQVPHECTDPSQCDRHPVKSNSSASSLSDLVNIAEVSIRRVIAMVKQVRYTCSFA